LVQTKSNDGHEWPKHVVLILILIFKDTHPLYHMSCVIDYPSTHIILFPKSDFSYCGFPWFCSFNPNKCKDTIIWHPLLFILFPTH